MSSNPKNPLTQSVLDPRKAFRLRQVESDAPSRAGLFRKLYSSPQRVSPRQAIKAFCLECVWMETTAIQTCTATACPLWPFRPYQPRKKESAP